MQRSFITTILQTTMSDLNLKFQDDGTADAGPGRYANKRAFDVLQRYLQRKISVKDAANAITAMLPEPGQSKTRGGEISLFGSFLCQMAEQIPYSNPAQARLVKLVQHVSLSPKLNGQGDDGVCASVPGCYLAVLLVGG